MTTYVCFIIKPTTSESSFTNKQYTEQQHFSTVDYQADITNSNVALINKNIIGLIAIYIIFKTNLFQKLRNNSLTYKLVDVKQVPISTIDYSLIYLFITISFLLVTILLIINVCSYPFLKVYKLVDKSKQLLYRTTVLTTSSIHKITNITYGIIFHLLNPHLVSQHELNNVQQILISKQETMTYMLKAAALRRLACKYNISLTSNNNNSFTVLANKSLIVDSWMTNHVEEVVIDRIASILSKINSVNKHSFLPVVNAFDLALFNKLKEEIKAQLKDLTVANETIPHYPLKLRLLNNTVFFLNQTTVKTVGTSLLVFVLNRPFSNVIRVCARNCATALFTISPVHTHPLILIKNRLETLIPVPIRQLKRHIVSLIPKPLTQIELMKMNFLNTWTRPNTLGRFVANLFLAALPNSYTELLLLIGFYILARRYIQSFLNKIAIYTIKQLTCVLDEQWKTTELGQDAIALFELNYNKSMASIETKKGDKL